VRNDKATPSVGVASLSEDTESAPNSTISPFCPGTGTSEQKAAAGVGAQFDLTDANRTLSETVWF